MAATPPADPVDPADGDQRLVGRIRFVESAGVSLAVAETGAGPCLVKTATWLTQVDKDTEASPVWGHWVRALSRRYHYVRYDPPGCGLSDRDLTGRDLSDVELWVDDLRRVVDAVGQERVALLGLSQGGPVAIAFAVRYPERVSHLVLYGTYGRGMTRRGDPVQVEEAARAGRHRTDRWGTRNASFRETFARQFVPDAQSDEIAWFNDQLQLTTDGTNAPLLGAAFHRLDVTDLARQVSVPTLVLHAVGDRAVPFEEGRHLAGLIPGARFVALNSRNHILLQRDAAFPSSSTRSNASSPAEGCAASSRDGQAAAPLRMRATWSGWRKSSGDIVPAMTLTKASMAAWLDWLAARSCCISGGGGSRVASCVVNS